MSGFKSFGNRTVSVSLAKGFTCIVGPNGNGKSNVIDALCFALGRMSKKTMRAKSLTDLIFAGSKGVKPATRAEVEIIFDNKAREFPYDNDEFKIGRFVRRKGASGYTIDGKKTTRETILNALAQANIDPDGSNQFVLQGKIVELTHMNPNSRRMYIEQLIGLAKYDQMKAQTMRELEKADKDLGEFEAIFKEVSIQLKKVEKEKNDALRWKELDNLVKHHNAQLIALKINTLRQDEEEVAEDIESTQLVIEELENKVARQKEKIEAESLFLDGIEADIQTHEGEKNIMDETLTTQKSQLSSKEASLAATHDSVARMEQNITKLEEQQEALEEGQTYNDLMALTTEEVGLTQQNIDETEGIIEETIGEQKQREAQITDINTEKARINGEISGVKQEIKGLTTTNKMLTGNIKKNTTKSAKLTKDLNRLKKEGESIEEAMLATKEESKGIQAQIQTLRNKIQEQKQKQTDLDKEIETLEGGRDTANQENADIQAAISSTSAQMTMQETRIEELNTKKQDLQKEFDRLTKGQKVEDQINELRNNEKTLSVDMKQAKDALKKANDEKKTADSKKEALDAKRRTFEAEIGDVERRLSGLNVEMKNHKNDLKAGQREQHESGIRSTNLEQTLADLKQKEEKLKSVIQKSSTKVAQLDEERRLMQEQITKKEADQEKSAHELSEVMTTLTELILNIDRSAGHVKSDIQNVSQVAIDEAGSVFKTFVMDITDMLGSIEELSSQKFEKAGELQEQLVYVVDTLKLLIENSEMPLIQMNEMVQEASDEALQESTSNFDGFIQDFTDKFDAIRMALQAIAVADTTEIYRTLEDLNENSQNENRNLSEANTQLAKISTQREQREAEFSQLTTQLKDLDKKIQDNQAKIEAGDQEYATKQQEIEQSNGEITKITEELTALKQFMDTFWTTSKEFQATIDTTSEELAKIAHDLNALATVKRMLEEIETATSEQEKLTQDIATKKDEINNLTTSSDTTKTKIAKILESIGKVKAAWKTADGTRNEFQTQIDEENEKLQEVADRLKDLETVQKIIDDIEGLARESQEAEEKIQENKEATVTLDEQIGVFEENLTQEDDKIATLQDERKKLEGTEAELRNTLSDLTTQKNQLEQTLGHQQRMQARAEEIDQLQFELGELQDAIVDLGEEIQNLAEKITQLEAERSEKLEQLSGFQKQKSESWNKQKALRDDLGEISADLSRNTAKMNNLETRKIVLEERIDELFEKSKDYGALPPVTDDLHEDTLNDSIAKASAEKKRLEPVNLKSIDEYDVIKERWDEIDMRRQTLQRERKAILDSIDRIELEKTRNFMKAYHEINRVFSSIFQKLSPGGSAKMILENPANPFEGGIGIEARPRGKKISSLEILSGGEKTLVALSFIFAIQNFYPAPFYIMDEIDAALDGPNVYRVSMVIKEYADQSQFLVISHREENITNSDRIYGVAMNNGITDVFTIDLEEEKDREDFGAEIEGMDEFDEDLDRPMVVDHDEEH